MFRYGVELRIERHVGGNDGGVANRLRAKVRADAIEGEEIGQNRTSSRTIRAGEGRLGHFTKP